MGNKEVRAETLRVMLIHIPGCGQNYSELARRTERSVLTIRSIIKEKKPENKDVQDAFWAEEVISPSEVKREREVKEMLRLIELHGADKFLIAEGLGCSPWTLMRKINDKRNPEVKIAYDEKRKIRDEQNKLERKLKRDNAQKELSLLKGESENEAVEYVSELSDEKIAENFLGHQVSFAEVSPEEVKHPAIVGGFGCGKTMSIPLRWLKLIEFRLAQGKKCELMVIEPTKEMIRDILVPAFDEFFERAGVKKKYLWDSGRYTIEYMGEKHVCLFRSGNRPSSLTGKNLSDIIIDEFDRMPYSKQRLVWRECIARIRRAPHGSCAVVSTPEGFKLVHELWVEKRSEKFALIKAKTSDNIHLPEDYIANLYEQYDSKLVKQYLEGEFVNIGTDLVYYCFDRNVNVVADGEIPPADEGRIILSFDFNVNPMCAAEIIMSGKTRYQIYEHKISSSNTKELCESVMESLKRRYKNWKMMSLLITGDASGSARSSSGSDSDYEIIKREFDEAGFAGAYVSVGSVNPPVRERANYVNSLLDKKLFFIGESCRESVKDREVVSWKKGSEKFVIDKSDRTATHLSDAADYGLWKSRFLVNNENGDNFVVIGGGRSYS